MIRGPTQNPAIRTGDAPRNVLGGPRPAPSLCAFQKIVATEAIAIAVTAPSRARRPPTGQGHKAVRKIDQPAEGRPNSNDDRRPSFAAPRASGRQDRKCSMIRRSATWKSEQLTQKPRKKHLSRAGVQGTICGRRSRVQNANRGCRATMDGLAERPRRAIVVGHSFTTAQGRAGSRGPQEALGIDVGQLGHAEPDHAGRRGT